MKFTKTDIAGSLFIAFVYFSIAILLLNPSLVFITLTARMSFLSKLTLLSTLVQSSWTALSHVDFFLLTTTSLLVGINVSCSLTLLKRLKKMGRINFAVGGGTMVGVFSAGCASCGFSAFSLFGAPGALALLPFDGLELYILAITLLLLSLYYNMKTLQNPLLCKR